MLSITKETFSEVYDIIYNMGIESEIPKSFIELIDSNRDKEYKVNIDYTQNLNKQELQKGTRVILSLIYRDYLCTPEEREILIQKDKEELKRIEEEIREKYNIDNLFKKKEEDKPKEEMQMIKIEKETFWTKILNKIKLFFKRK